MADRVLYFPSIEVPKGEWFARVLLYWDSVGTIMPAGALEDPNVVTPYTAELVAHKLLEAVPPDYTIWSSGAHNYQQAFLDLLDRHPRLQSDTPLAERPRVRVHTDKTGFGLAYELERRGLARFLNGPEYSGWFEVEKQAAYLLMAYLATILARGSQLATDPITDRQECLAAFDYVRDGSSSANLTEGVVTETEPIRTQIIRGVLPASSEIIRVGEIADFKDRHRDLLGPFRRAIEEKIIEIAAIGDARLRARQLELATESFKAQRDEIVARMEERGWRGVGLGALAGVVAAGLFMADAAISGGELTRAGASVGLASAVWNAFDGSKTPRELFERPMAYAALAQQQLP